MSSKEFYDLKLGVEKEINKWKAAGEDNDNLRCWIIGYICGTAGTGKEEVFTASQLKELFAMTFNN